MLLIEQVVTIGVVDFQVADVNLELVSGHLSHSFEDIRECSWNDATISVPFCTTRDSECLTRARLSVSEYGAIVTLKAAINHILCDLLKDSLLLREHVKDASELELVVVILDLSVAQTVSLEVKLDFALVWCQSQTRVRLLGWPYSQVHLNALLLRYFAHF